MKLVQRVQDILLRPDATWPRIKQERADTVSLYKDYLIYLAAIPAVAGFISTTLTGAASFLSALALMVLSYLLSLGMVFGLALITNALAPSFKGRKKKTDALKLVAYGLTPAFVGGIFTLIPSLSVLAVLASLYSVQLLYAGVPVLMKSPRDKAIAYTAVIAVCGIIAGIVVIAASAAMLPSQGFSRVGNAKGDSIAASAPQGGRKPDLARPTEAPRDSSNDATAILAAQSLQAQAQIGAPMAAQVLKASLPETLGAFKRSSIEAMGPELGLSKSFAKAVYIDASGRSLRLNITDLGVTASLAQLIGWASTPLNRETDFNIERVYKQGSRAVRENHLKDGSHSEYIVLLGNGLLIEAEGHELGGAALKAAVEELDLARLESMKRPPAKP